MKFGGYVSVELHTDTAHDIKSIEYYGQEIEEIILVGGSARMPKIAKYLSLNLGLKVNIGISPYASQLKRKSVLFNVVIGLALRNWLSHPSSNVINTTVLAFRLNLKSSNVTLEISFTLALQLNLTDTIIIFHDSSFDVIKSNGITFFLPS
jgi:hypothetical protein